MTKVLNLDKLAKEKRVLTFGGEKYPMKELSVNGFIELTKRAEEIEKLEGDSLATRISFLVETVQMSFPTCPAEVLGEKSLDELNAIVAFARDGSIPSDEDESEEGSEEKKEQSQS